MAITTHSGQQQQQQQPFQSAPPPTTSLRSLLNQGLSLTEAKDIKEKCGKCSATLWSNTVPVRCNCCNKGFCQKCSTGPKAWSHDISWNCDKCAKILQQSSSVNITQLPAPTNTIPSLQLPTQSWDKLTIIQWNVDGICLKLLELHDRLINSDIDIVATQESKVCKADKTWLIEGYSTIQKEQNILGNGLLFFVRNDVIFKNLHSLKQTSMEILSIQVCTSKSLQIEVYNIYIPNTTTQQTHFDPNLINQSPYYIIIGNFNWHSHLWHHAQPPDARGDKITGWIIDKDLHMLKDGSATCPSRITRNDSTQNLSLCGYNWSTKTSWTLAEPIGNSEHLPITIIINHNHQSSSIHISLFNNDSHIFNLTSRRQDQTK